MHGRRVIWRDREDPHIVTARCGVIVAVQAIAAVVVNAVEERQAVFAQRQEVGNRQRERGREQRVRRREWDYDVIAVVVRAVQARRTEF